MEIFPPVDPKTLEEMHQIWIIIKSLAVPAAIGAGLIKLRLWASANRHDQKEGLIHPTRKGRPNYRK